MVLSFIVTFSYILLFVGSIYVCAQVSAPNCTNASLDWSFNSLDQNPCLVAAYLLAVCSSGRYVMSALLLGESYEGPGGPVVSNLCQCNTVVYCLISACDACQGGSWTKWSEWSLNCDTKAAQGTFPEAIPLGTRIPNWAYINPVPGDNWNLSTAQIAASANSPEVTGTASLVSTSTTANPSTGTPTSTSSSKNKMRIGAIAVGVLGGIITAGSIAAVVAWLVIRRRRTHPVPSPIKEEKTGEMEEQPTEPYHFGTRQRIYDPSDPSTHPSPRAL
ncbi:hypothetical protein BGW80DRAFT_303504 [Lactifluus volemus]|nr:hypothetical protein BGW80DRAFT_303504 [Lactifluus volemus]